MPFRIALTKLALCVVAVAGAAGVGTTAAGAHGGEAIIEVTSVDPIGSSNESMTYDVEVRIVWSDDLHPAENAVVTAVAIDSTGVTTAPATMPIVDADGHYEGEIIATGTAPFTLRVTSADPDGTIDSPLPQPAFPPPTTIAAAPTSEPATPSPTTVLSTTTTDPAVDAESASTVDDDGGGFPWGWVVAGLGVGAMAGTATMLARQRRLDAEHPPYDPGT